MCVRDYDHQVPYGVINTKKNRILSVEEKPVHKFFVNAGIKVSMAASLSTITGATPIKERERLFQSFREGETRVLVVSKVANFSIDLPEAGVAIQISGTFGSRQEEAQRLGRILRPKGDKRSAHFYTIVTRDTVDADFAAHRQRFLAEQGYAYRIIDADDLLYGNPVAE